MNYRMMGRFNAFIIAIEAVFMLPAMILSFGAHAPRAGGAFLITMAVCAVLSAVLFFFGRHAGRGFYAKEGLLCVGISWIVMSLLGALPFFFSGEIPHYIDALFEISSGFTTTGATVLSDVEGLSRGLLYWRSFSHWLGGMGVLVFLLAIAPVGGRNEGFTLHLLRAESPGPEVGKLVPRMRQTAVILYSAYIVLTVIDIILLSFGMPFFDALCTAFGTAGTGGFGIRNDSIASYSPYVQNVCTVFMSLFGINFTVYYLALLGNIRSILRNEELRLYLGIMTVSTVLITLNIRPLYAGVGEALRHAAFQVSSIMTTTGFSTVDFDLWPTFSKAVLLLLMAVGAMAGSTGGGLKCIRLLMLCKIALRNLRQMLRPRRVQAIHINGEPVSEQTLANTNAYFSVYVLFIVLSFLLVCADGFFTGGSSLITNFSAVMACFNNIGPGFEAVGPACHYGDFGILSKLVLIVDMLAGRLEIFPILVLLYPSAWKRNA